ncbi:MAG TPA: VRR-NUC domain-containing protein [Thermoanaerobaculia bacterium]|nr:VRR-NUC domain-containing protein [Thermoanaerobaculia bacterium]
MPHQLRHGVDLRSQERVKVNLGFQPGICDECRGLPPKAYPKAQLHGSTSKIRRYYWREIFFATRRKIHALQMSAKEITAEHRQRIENEVLEQIKAQHAIAPRYSFSEHSQQEVIGAYGVETVALHADFAPPDETGKTRARIIDGATLISVEEFGASYLRSLGYQVLFSESTPFHTLFAVFLHRLIQDPGDPKVRKVAFGERAGFEQHRASRWRIWTDLPEDMGTPGYGARRRENIEEQLRSIGANCQEVLDLFDANVEPSADLRQYLWVHRDKDVALARTVTQILSPATLKTILRYLVDDYWGRKLGWPDLLASRGTELLFAEVKASRDRLNEDQKGWIRGNSVHLHLPFKLIKIHRLQKRQRMRGAPGPHGPARQT